jgi:hypothetical protein
MAGRYDGSTTLTYLADGVMVHYLAPRTLPMAPTTSTVTSVRPEEVNRLDQIAARTLSNALLAWTIADANNAMDPFDLCAIPGSVLALPATGL